MPEITPIPPAEPVAPSPAELFEKLLERIETGKLELPLLPRTATQILALCQSGECDMKDLADLVQRDPTLAANVMRVANSAAHGGVERIVSLQQAASRLGFSALCEVATAIAVRGKVFTLRGRELELAQLWRHSATTGAWAKEIARKRRRNVEGAFLCGLLHDVGQPVLMQLVHELAGGVASPAIEAEHSLCERYHAEIGARLLIDWDMPEWMIAAIDAHHAPLEADEHAEQAWILLLADDLALWSAAVGANATSALPAHAARSADELEAALRAHAALEPLSLYAEDIDALLALRRDVEAFAEAFA